MSQIALHLTGPQLRLKLKEALIEKNYKSMTVLGLSDLLGITVSDAIDLTNGTLPSIRAIHKAIGFILNAPVLPEPWVIPAQPIVNFCPNEVVYAQRP